MATQYFGGLDTNNQDIAYDTVTRTFTFYAATFTQPPTIASFANAAHDHADAAGGATLSAAVITAGTLKHERGGLEIDVSAADGIPKISGGSTSILASPAGTIVGTTDTQSLTNKTITATAVSCPDPTGAGGAANECFGATAGATLEAGAQFNCLVGYAAGTALTTGDGNTALGALAGWKLTTGSENCLVGTQAGGDITITSYSTLVGYHAGLKVTGNSNTLIGWEAGGQIVAGADNVSIGRDAQGFNVTGSRNTTVGYHAANGVYGGSFSDTTCVGANAGLLCTSGDQNVFIGSSAGANCTTGNANIVIGYNVSLPAADTANHLNIGDLIKGTLSGTLAINLFGGTPGTQHAKINDPTDLAACITAITAIIDALEAVGISAT